MTLGSHCSEQCGIVDIDTSVAGNEKMVIELYSNCGSGDDYFTPLLEVTIVEGKDWSLTGGDGKRGAKDGRGEATTLNCIAQ